MNIRELAKIAGVSPAAVSLALNQKPGISSSTRERILKIAQEYEYLPVSSASIPRNVLFLKYIKHGMIVEENAGFISSVIDSIENDCRAQGYTLNILLSENNLEATLDSINYTNFCGIIVLGTELDQSSYSLLEGIPIPYVVVDNNMPHFSCNSIAIDNYEIVYGALAHLAKLGHREIAYFKSNIKIQNFIERSRAFYKYAERFNFIFDRRNEFQVTPTLLGSLQSITPILEKRPHLPTCAFADNDTIAIGITKALKKAGYKIPEDISIIGFDDIPFAAVNSPTLSTMNVPKKLIGTQALHQLHMMIEGRQMIHLKTRVNGTLVPRHSTSAPVC